jgi:sterol desaturase/sphingolipid hydroxylase (fatty acid hydroxylase superfamily)
LDVGTRIAGGILSPIFDLAWSFDSKIFWLYLVSSGLIAGVVYLRNASAPSLRGALEFLAPKSVVAHRSAIADYKIWVLNNILLIVVFFPYFALSTLTAAHATLTGLREISGLPGLAWPVNWFTVALYTFADLLAIDAGLFVAHYLQHRVPFLWEFHKTHHSAEVLTPITVARMHPVDQIVNYTMVAALPGGMAGIFSFLYAQPVPVFTISGLNIGLFFFYLAGIPLRHSQIWVMYPRWIARHISSPAMHMIHHSKDPKHADKNLAQVFNFWDRLAGTLYMPAEREIIEFGLWNGESEKFRTLTDLYAQPFRSLGSRFRQLRSLSPTKRPDPIARD